MLSIFLLADRTLPGVDIFNNLFQSVLLLAIASIVAGLIWLYVSYAPLKDILLLSVALTLTNLLIATDASFVKNWVLPLVVIVFVSFTIHGIRQLRKG